MVFVPVVISADNAPSLGGASPYLTLFNTSIGAVDLNTAGGRALAVEAITATSAEGADYRSLCDLILGIASYAACEHLEKLMAISYKSKFVDGWLEQGHALGKAEGRAGGEAQARADDILRVLQSRRMRTTHAQRQLIDTCKDLAKLDTWFDRSLTAATVEEILEAEG